MKKLIVPLAIVGMLMLLAAAVAWDCVRLAADARHRVSLADQEMKKYELRLVKLLSASSASSPEVQSAVASHQKAGDLEGRHEAYEQLVASFRKSMADEIDPNNPLDRKFMDDVAGAINRRDVAEKQYNDEAAACESFLNSWRGRLAASL